MKKNYFLVAFFALTMIGASAQFVDDMENCDPLPPWWGSWSGTSADGIICSSNQAHSGGLSGYIDGGGAIDAILILDNQTSGGMVSRILGLCAFRFIWLF